jgi:gamma-glutamyltranspeptidase/glutathione hydrolase
MKSALAAFCAALMTTTSVLAADLSPPSWPSDARIQAEKTEAQRWDPDTLQTVSGSNGVVSAIISPVAVQAGLQALRQGGNAADAAATMALTQITRQLGSVVSYAGIMTLLYYDAKTGKVYALDAGYNSYKGETDPKSIPVSDLGPLNFGRKPTVGGPRGRETLVPGFMAGIQALHDRFGKLPFKDLFAPAIWYAKNGVTISPHLAAFFKLRESFLAKSPEGRIFMHQGGDELPQPGDKFVQTKLAATLEAVAAHGAQYMYTGAWGREFVDAVRKQGGKATLADMKNYRVWWNDPYSDTVFGHTVYVSGPPSNAAYEVLTGLKMAAALKLDQRPSYAKDPASFRDLSRISEFVSAAPDFGPSTAAILHAKGIDNSRDAQRTKGFADAAAAALDDLYAPPANADTHHSNSVVVVDKDGNIAVMTHTINAVIWGDTGIVVGGIPLPDSAGFQQARLATLKPGDRVPHEIACTLTFDGKHPVLATAPIGSSLVPETIRVILGVIGQKRDLTEVTAEPPLLVNFALAEAPLASRSFDIPAGAYDPKFLDGLKALGVTVSEIPDATAKGLRGTLTSVAIDPTTGRASSPEVPSVMAFAGAN